MNATDLHPGYYFYYRPGWSTHVRIRVENNGSIRFTEGFYPNRAEDIPADAQFSPAPAGPLGPINADKAEIMQQAKLLLRFLTKQKPIPQDHSHTWWIDQVTFFLADEYGYTNFSQGRGDFIHVLFQILDEYVLENWKTGIFSQQANA